MDAAASHWLSLLLPGAFWPGVAVLVWVPLLALALDAWSGEPPAAWHPVVWMGNALEWWVRAISRPSKPGSASADSGWRSTRATFKDWSASALARHRPTGPAPMMRTS